MATATFRSIMRNHSTLVRSAAIAIAVTATVTLSGCFANPLDQITDKIGSGIAEGGAEKLVEGMTGADLDIESGKIPEDFPSEVPMIDGPIQSSFSMKVDTGKTWTVAVEVKDVAAAANAAREKLTSAGFEESMWSEGEGMTMGMYSRDTLSVIISGIADDSDAQLVSYQVIQDTSK